MEERLCECARYASATTTTTTTADVDRVINGCRATIYNTSRVNVTPHATR